MEGPSASLNFVGILDTHQKEICLPEDILQCIYQELSSWLHRKTATKNRHSITCRLAPACNESCQKWKNLCGTNVQYCHRAERVDIFTRLNKDFCSNLYWWYTFISSWNGLSILRNANLNMPSDFCIQTDASGSWECGACWGYHWSLWLWPKEWEPVEIMAKELVHIIIRCAVWGL